MTESASDPTHQYHHSPAGDGPVVMSVTPDNAGWKYLSFDVIKLAAGATYEWRSDDHEAAAVPLSGAFTATAGDQTHEMSRTSVFEEGAEVLYFPPRTDFSVVATTDCEFSLGWAPAEGKYPVRLVVKADIKDEIRGGGAAYRQVRHILAMPLPAERLIMYEVYVPRGTWGGWPPHNHDGLDGSPYLEEVYYFRTDPSHGFALHRNWREDEGEPFNQLFSPNDGDVVLVPKGYHSTVAAPGSHMYFLNYLAGDLTNDDRITPPCFHQGWTWIEDDWNKDGWELPVV